MTIHVRYFAGLRDRRGVGRESLETKCKTPSELYLSLGEQFELKLEPARVRFAVRDAYVDGNYELQDGDELVLIPPVAGG